MEIVFEIMSRATRTLERRQLESEGLRIGRAFDNDLILTDPSVSPYHALIRRDPDGALILVDLDSLNGTWGPGHARLRGASRLRSGAEYRFGRARARFYRADHPVADTIPAGGTDRLISRLGRPGVALILATFVAIFAAVERWNTAATDIPWYEYFTAMMAVLAACMIVASCWAIVGRVVKHEGHFSLQFILIMIYLVLQTGVIFGAEVLLFNTLNFGFSAFVSVVLSVVLLAGLFWFNLYLATHLSPRHRGLFACTAAVVLVATAIYPAAVERHGFSKSPYYVSEIKPPALLFRTPRDADYFIGKANAIFANVVHEAD